MPKIKRWFPVSHDINHSPTTRMLVHEYGAPGLRIWLEILSIADRAGPFIDCCSEGAISRLSSAAETKSRVTRSVLEALLKAGSIKHEGHFIVDSYALDSHLIVTSCALHSRINHVTEVVNYSEYHRTEERIMFPPDLTRPNLPDLTRPKSVHGTPRALSKPELVIDNDLGLGNQHPAVLCGWDLWNRLEQFWRVKGRRITIFQVEMTYKLLFDARSKGHDPTKIVERSLRNGWMDLYEPDKEPAGPSKVFDRDAIRQLCIENGKTWKAQK